MRLFETSMTRDCCTLDGLWAFAIDPAGEGETQKWYQQFPHEHDMMCVPACWNCTPTYFAYEGKAWYQTEFTAASDCYVLEFESVLYQADVYIDGEKAASHYGGFTGFSVTGCGKGVHTLTVAVDNTHNLSNTIPLSVVDWYHYGGIAGGVCITSFAAAYIENHRISYALRGACATGQVEFTISGEYDGKAAIIFDGKPLAEAHVHSGFNCVTVDFGEIIRWDTDCPKLYLLRIAIDTDDIAERIGFRTVEIEGKQILLNGRPLILKGVNRHHEHPDFGFSMPLSLAKRDADIIREMGCNLIRGSHYPNPPAFLDYLDSIGMLFWEEVPMWGFGEAAVSDPLTQARGLQLHSEMVTRDYHHPSIILWGLHNEICTDTQAGCEITRDFYTHVKRQDASRPITYASNKPYTDISFANADVLSLNLYPAWYGGREIEQEMKETLDGLKTHLRETGNYDKPLLISEFGGGAIYGERSLYRAKWTEGYQCELLETLVTGFLQDADISGVVIWQYCDMRSCFEKELERPRSFNNKGVLDEYRRPKMAYETVRRIYGAQKGRK